MTEWSCKCGNLVLRCDSIKEGRLVSDPRFTERLLCTDSSCVQKVSATKWSANSKHKWLAMTLHTQFGTDELPTEVAEALPAFATSECTIYSCAVCQVRLYATLSVGQQEAVMIANESRRIATASQNASSKHVQSLALFDIVLPDNIKPVDSSTLADVNFNFDVAHARLEIEAVTNRYVTQKTEEFRVALENLVRSAQRDKERLLAHIGKVFAEVPVIPVGSGKSNDKQLQQRSELPEKSSDQSSGLAVVIDQLGSELEDAVLAEMDIEEVDRAKEARTAEERERLGVAVAKVSESSNDDGAVNFKATSSEREMLELELGEEAIERSSRPLRARGDGASGLYSSSVPIGIPLREVNTKRRVGEIATVAEHEDEHDNPPMPLPQATRASKPTDVPKPAASPGEGAPMLFGASLRTLRAHTLTEADMETQQHEHLQRTVEENDERTSEIGRKMAQSVRQADAFNVFERPQRSRQRAFTNEAMSTRTPALATSSKQPHIVTFK